MEMQQVQGQYGVANELNRWRCVPVVLILSEFGTPLD